MLLYELPEKILARMAHCYVRRSRDAGL